MLFIRLLAGYLLMFRLTLWCWSYRYSSVWLSFSEVDLFQLDFRLVPSGSIFLFLVLVVRITILIYSGYYMREEFRVGYYLRLMTIFILRMVGLLCTRNWSVLIISWEGLGVRRFLLINYYQAWDRYNNAVATVITIRIGDFILFLGLGFFMLNSYMGILTADVVVLEQAWLVVMVLTKSAQFPFRSWLPMAMRAPTPTSALVHSSTLVTAGLVVLITYIEDFILYTPTLKLLTFVGFTTILGGSLAAIFDRNIKKLIAYRTLSQIGLGVITCGLGRLTVGYYNLIAHGFAKSLLFVQAGYLIHCGYNQQNVRTWSRVGSVEGLMRIQLFLRLSSLCGISFHSGIVTKEAVLGQVNRSRWSLIFLVGLTVSIYLTFCYRVLIYKRLFNTRLNSIMSNHRSRIILVVTLVEVVLVFAYFRWFIMNVVVFPHNFITVEVYFPLIVLIVMRLGSMYLTDSGMRFSVFKRLFDPMSGGHGVSLVKYIFTMLWWGEPHCYRILSMISTTALGIRIKRLGLNLGRLDLSIIFMVVSTILLM